MITNKFFITLLLIVAAPFSMADELSIGYQVLEPKKTVIQIARDVYGDERLWKKIARVNGLKSPYDLKLGQVLVLPLKPKFKLSNLVHDSRVPRPNFSAKLPSVSQVIESRQDYVVYVVNERAPSLSMVALENYGDKSMSKLIARWNGLAADDRLSLSQRLVFRKLPTQSQKEADKILVAEWLRLGNSEMADRIAGLTNDKSPLDKIESAPMTKLIHKSDDAVLPIAERPKALPVPLSDPQLAPPIEQVEEMTASKKTEATSAEVNTTSEVKGSAPATAIPIVEPVMNPKPLEVQPTVTAETAPIIEKSPDKVLDETNKRLPEKVSTSTVVKPQENQIHTSPSEAVVISTPESKSIPVESKSLIVSPGPETEAQDLRKPASASTLSAASQEGASAIHGEQEPTSESYWLGSDIHRILKVLSKDSNE